MIGFRLRSSKWVTSYRFSIVAQVSLACTVYHSQQSVVVLNFTGILVGGGIGAQLVDEGSVEIEDTDAVRDALETSSDEVDADVVDE